MKKVLLIIPLTILTSLIPYLLSFTNFYDKIDPVQFNLYFYIVWTVLFLIGLLIITDILTVKEVFFFTVRKKYLPTTATIRKKRITNVVYGGSEGGYDGSRQWEYKIEYRDNEGIIHKTNYITGKSESQFASLLNWELGTRIKMLHSPNKPTKILVDRDYYKNQLKQKQQQAKDDWDKEF